MKIFRATVALALYLLILVATYVIHIYHFNVNVVFFDAIGDAVIATVVAAALLFSLKYFQVLNHFEKFQMLLIWLLTGYALAISIPTVIDRSLSFYILEKLHQRGGGVRLDRFEEVFTKEYVKEHRLVDIRLTEQEASGTITIVNGCVKLTPKGENIEAFSRAFRKHLLPKQRLIMGSYSADLTDPFKNSIEQVDYTCH
jgi:hypothetical protein